MNAPKGQESRSSYLLQPADSPKDRICPLHSLENFSSAPSVASTFTMPGGEIARQWFIPGEGIDRHVISADIQRYLGNDATVRPGQGSGENQVRQQQTTMASTLVLTCLRA